MPARKFRDATREFLAALLARMERGPVLVLDAGAVSTLSGGGSDLARHDGRVWRYTGGDVGLATSGSGDVLAGIIAGLAARELAPELPALMENAAGG